MSDFLLIEGLPVPVARGTRLASADHGVQRRAYSGRMRSETRGRFRSGAVQTGLLTELEYRTLEALLRTPGPLMVSGPAVGEEALFHASAVQFSPITADAWRATFELHETRHQPAPMLLSWHPEAPGPEEFERDSAAIQVERDGSLFEVGAHVRRTSWVVGPDGKLVAVAPIEPERTNRIRNPRGAGATVGVVGSGGALPTNWLSTTQGFALEVVGLGMIGDLPYIDILVAGTPNATAAIGIRPEGNTQVVAEQGQHWAGTMYAGLVGGSLANVTGVNMTLTERSDVGTGLESTSTPFTLGAFARRRVLRTLTNASTERVEHRLNIGVTNGQAVNLTVRVAGPQLERGRFPSTLVFPPVGTPGAQTRPQEVLTLPHVHAPQPGVYFGMARLGHDGLGGMTNGRWWHVGASNNSAPRLLMRNASDTSLALTYDPNGDQSTTTLSDLTLSEGEWVDYAFVHRADGSGRFIVITHENQALVAGAVAAPAAGLVPAWSAPEIHVGSRGGSDPSSHQHAGLTFFPARVISSPTDGTADAALMQELRAKSRARLHPRTAT